MPRIALGLSYLGTNYNGWQSQPDGKTIQDHLQLALSRFADEPLTVICAGRTDAGVHALMQVVHFDSSRERESFAWMRAVNRYLPKDITVEWARPVSQQFHARANALARRYVYALYCSPVRSAIGGAHLGWSFRPLNAQAMQQAADLLLGEHDFSSFRAAACQALSPVKCLQRLAITQHGAYWRFEFQADAFLHHMIRNIMGCLIQIGQGLREPQWIAQVLAARSRAAAAPTFMPEGLYFLGPIYDRQWALPERTAAFDWLPGSNKT